MYDNPFSYRPIIQVEILTGGWENNGQTFYRKKFDSTTIPAKSDNIRAFGVLATRLSSCAALILCSKPDADGRKTFLHIYEV